MRKKTTLVSRLLIATGIGFLVVHTVAPFLWALLGMRGAYPLVGASGPGLYLAGFSPAIGGLLLVLGAILSTTSTRRPE